MRSRVVALTLAVSLWAGLAAHAQEITIVDNLPGAVIDISQTGTSLNQHFDEENDVTTLIGNTVFPAGNVRVGRNGAAAFVNAGTGSQLNPINFTLPSNQEFNGARTIAAYWDDIGNHRDGSDTWVQQNFGVEHGTLIIQWKGTVAGLLPAQPLLDFQVQVFSPPRTINGETVFAQILYTEISEVPALGGSSATIGVQAEPGAPSPVRTVQWSFNTAGAVGDGGVLSVVLGCPADFNRDGFVDFFDYDDYIHCFEGSFCPPGRDADFNGDGFLDFFDLDAYTHQFEGGCP